MEHVAELLHEAYQSSQPITREYHIPFIQEDETYNIPTLAAISTARCARVSYLTHEGKRDITKDLDLHDRLEADSHMSPFEHVARAMTDLDMWENPKSGNFFGWHQYRHRKDLFVCEG
jgi:thymidylate synthase ThyX